MLHVKPGKQQELSAGDTTSPLSLLNDRYSDPDGRVITLIGYRVSIYATGARPFSRMRARNGVTVTDLSRMMFDGTFGVFSSLFENRQSPSQGF